MSFFLVHVHDSACFLPVVGCDRDVACFNSRLVECAVGKNTVYFVVWPVVDSKAAGIRSLALWCLRRQQASALSFSPLAWLFVTFRLINLSDHCLSRNIPLLELSSGESDHVLGLWLCFFKTMREGAVKPPGGRSVSLGIFPPNR